MCGSHLDLETWLLPEPIGVHKPPEAFDSSEMLKEVRTTVVRYLEKAKGGSLTMNQVCLMDDKKVLQVIRTLAKLTNSSRQRGYCMHFLELANPNNEFWTWDKQKITNPKLILRSLQYQ